MQITKVLVIWARYWFFFLLLLDLQGKVAIIKSLWIHNSFWIFFFFFNTLLIWLPWRTKIKSVLNKLKVYKKISCSIFFFFWLFISSPELCSGWAIVITFRPSFVRPSVNIFKRLLLWSRWVNFAQISYGASLGWGKELLLKWSRFVDQDGRHAHIW